MLNNLSTIDPRAIYSTVQLEKIKAEAKMRGLIGAERKDFKRILDKEIKKKQLMEVAQQLESLFINMMFKSMRKNINKHRLIKENPAENIFNDMLYQEYSLQMAKADNFGLAKQIYEQYSQYI